MRFIGILGAIIAACIAIGSGFALLVAPSPLTLVILLLALILFFIALAAAARRGDGRTMVSAGSAAIAPPMPVKREPDIVKLRRSAAKLGVELPPEPNRPAALNEDAANEALRDILGRRRAR